MQQRAYYDSSFSFNYSQFHNRQNLHETHGSLFVIIIMYLPLCANETTFNRLIFTLLFQTHSIHEYAIDKWEKKYSHLCSRKWTVWIEFAGNMQQRVMCITREKKFHSFAITVLYSVVFTLNLNEWNEKTDRKVGQVESIHYFNSTDGIRPKR